MATVALIGTCDTKLEELLFLRDQIRHTGNVDVWMIDAGRKNVQHDAITTTQAELVSRFGSKAGGRDPAELPRGEVIKFMISCATAMVTELCAADKIHGIVSAGGSGGTSLASAVMKALPIGFPKLIVSTVASGDTGPIVGETDLTLMYSVVDVAGLNQVLRNILSNAGAAIAGAARAYASRRETEQQQQGQGGGPRKQRVGITMFGVTTPAVDTIRRHLEANYAIETYIFHATGHGGKAMERLIRDGELDAVLDLTTTEICDFITGGVFSAGETRLDAAAAAGIPNIVSLGATDMTNFGPPSTVPEAYKDRRLYEHNPVVTLMRSSEDESRQVGEFISSKLKKAKAPEMVQLWIPKGGISMIATPGGPFEDKTADEALFRAVREGLAGSGVDVVEDERDVNNAGFAVEIAEALTRKMGLSKN